MSITHFITTLKDSPDSVNFNDTIGLIDLHYHFTPTAFLNGNLQNEVGQNNGSCKIFAFGLHNRLNEDQLLACFGEYYRHDVLNRPDAEDHQNIRQFILNGWSGIKFSDMALRPKSE